MASPHGRAIRSWTEGIGVVAPIALTAGAGYAIGSIDPQGASATWGAILGALGGFLSVPFQTASSKSLVPTYKRAGHESPYWATFLNVTGYMTLPATVIGTGVAVGGGGGWGVTAAVVAGVVGSLLGLHAQSYRLKDHPPK